MKEEYKLYQMTVSFPVVVHAASSQMAQEQAKQLVNSGVRAAADVTDSKEITDVKDLTPPWMGSSFPYGKFPAHLDKLNIKELLDAHNREEVEKKLKEAKAAKIAIEKAIKSMEEANGVLASHEQMLAALGYVYDHNKREYVIKK